MCNHNLFFLPLGENIIGLMALRIKGHGGHALDQQQYDMFWTEFRAIEESRSPVAEEDHDEESSKEPPGGTCLVSYNICRDVVFQSGLSLSFNSLVALIFTLIANLLVSISELYQLQADSPVTSRVHQTYSAILGVMGYSPH